MGNFFNRFGWPSREHVGEDVLLSLLDGELSSMQTRKVQKHLERCWTCRARRDQLEKTIGRFVGYRKHLVAPYMPPPPRGREMFLAKLDEMIQARKQPWWNRPAQTLRRMTPQTMSPTFASALVVGVAAVLLLFIWQRNLPPVSAHQLLIKAQVWDVQPSQVTPSVVVYQKIEIRTKTKKLQRAIYRDVAGKRKPRPMTLSRSDEAIKKEMESAGVNWQEPLSATNFREWHDAQPTVSDKVTRSSDFLLTLTTLLPSGPIESETLTVRANDFHPVGRTIEMRDADDRIEIAELNYAVLGWNEVNEALFEPLTPGVPAVTPAIVGSLHLPTLPTMEQLDLAELQARLVLNRLNADSTEQLEFTRSSSAIQVKGIVESTQRKNALVAQLRQVPHVVPAIFSIEELHAHMDSETGISSVKTYSVVGQPSPLEQFFKEHGKDQAAVSQVSQRLLDAAASVKQESSALSELLQRFASDPNLGDSGKSMLTELVGRHVATLQTALDTEDNVIGNNLFPSEINHDAGSAVDISPTALADSGGRNMALCREFISAGDTTPRPAETIASDLLSSTQQLRAILRGLSNSRASSQVPHASPQN
jgi:hypothetical protein